MAVQIPALTIRRNFSRPDTAHVAALTGVQSGYVVDARGRRGALDHHIRPLTVATDFVGTAVTVQTRPRDNLAPWAALTLCQPGDVLVIACSAYEEASIIGDILVAMAKNNGVVACVTDGMARDIAGINAVGIPVFGRGLTPNSPFKDGPGEIGTSIVLGGMTVNSGDVLVGDRDGLVWSWCRAWSSPRCWGNSTWCAPRRRGWTPPSRPAKRRRTGSTRRSRSKACATFK